MWKPRPIYCLLATGWGLLSVLASPAQSTVNGTSVWSPYRETKQATASISDLRPLPVPHNAVTDSALDKLRTARRPLPYEQAGVPGEFVMDESLIDGECLMCNGPVVQRNADVWQWRLLPDEVIWHSYWAGAHEPRISGVTFFDAENGIAFLDVTLGGRVGILRYGTGDHPSAGRPQGWQFDIEGAASPRLNLDEDWDVEAVDFRFGLPISYGQDNWQLKFSYYHLSSHMGDEFAVRTGKLGERINFSRDTLVLAGSYYPMPSLRLYAEMGWAFYADEGTEPWEFQFGFDYARPGPTGLAGTPFVAINGHLREEHNYGGNVVLQAGWLWRGDNELRLGFHYFNGKTNQFAFFDEFEEQIGAGLWYEY